MFETEQLKPTKTIIIEATGFMISFFKILKLGSAIIKRELS